MEDINYSREFDHLFIDGVTTVWHSQRKNLEIGWECYDSRCSLLAAR